MPTSAERFKRTSSQLNALLDQDPSEAVRQARAINLNLPDELEGINLMGLSAAVLVDGGVLAKDMSAILEGLSLYRELHKYFPTDDVTYNLANALIASVGHPPQQDWLIHQELTRADRAEARRCLWKVANNESADRSLQSQAWTNLANQFSASYRLGEAHDARLVALEMDPSNGVAAIGIARELLWLYKQGNCSEVTLTEAAMMAKVATQHYDQVVQYAGVQFAKEISEFAGRFENPPPRVAHEDDFVYWVERERLTLAPSVELVDPSLGKMDWLMLPGILERQKNSGGAPPPIFAMFNSLKSDFILARDLAWCATQEGVWPTTGRFSDTLDYANYGPDSSALILAHRTSLDLLDKVAVTANHYFEFGENPRDVTFGNLWRGKPDVNGIRPLSEPIRKTILGGVTALYGLVELAEDYDNSTGILRSQKNLRNAGTHRFVVLHDLGDPDNSRKAPEIERHRLEEFRKEMLKALRIARSAIQMLTLSITQHEKGLTERIEGVIGSMVVPDHDYIRGRDQ
ncbi:LA2681 family HEPN domain-containing protein [Oxalicibacterium solurbis]|uniref:LA2681-like HEPN domain-containing protein n=1 Tax=Oxalicibacterium solurbis TaxID=69280 RepID=A0A8J3AU43_9BURK|nr:LA2681 family HEPN domain-containing protein [Oxalicibacterium solurbis]GGI53215.1 hypothetical protein GCM10011430_03890 [Oxalicibacterium solurbis]